MKRFLALAALVLGLASCQTEPEGLDVIVGGEVDTYITVALPEATRANSADGFDLGTLGTTDYNLRYILEIYRVENEQVLYSTCQRFVETSDDTSMVFPVRLAPGYNYRIVAWTDIVEGNSKEDRYYYTEAGLDEIAILDNGTVNWNAMDETRDAYTCVKVVNNFNSASNLDMTLTRPFAKVRVVATDIEDILKVGLEPKSATVEYAQDMFFKYNAVAETYAHTDSKNHNISYPATPVYEDATGEMTLFADYIFVPSTGTAKFSLNVYADANQSKLIKSNNFNTEIFVERNKLTTIKGDVLTVGGNVKVTVDNGLGVKDVINIVDTPNSLIDAIEDAEPGKKTNIELGGDIDLSELFGAGILSTRAAEPTYGLLIPAGSEVVLDLNGFTISQSKACDASYSMIVNKGQLTITGEGAIEFTNTAVGDGITWGTYTIENRGEAVLTIDNATIRHNGCVDGETEHYTNIAIQNYEGKVVINDGTIASPEFRSLRDFTAGGEIIINGGTFVGQVWMQGLGNGSSSLTITGGSFSPVEGYDGSSVYIANSTNVVNVAITGGLFNTKVGCYDATKDGAKGCITGGTFTTAAKEATNEALLNSDYEFVDNGDDTWTVDSKGYYTDENGNYCIISAKGLVALSSMTIAGGKSVKLGADIDLAGVNFNGLRAFNPENSNTFDGQNYTVSNWTVNNRENDMAFLRSWVGTIKNVKFEECHLMVGGRSAIVAANIYANIENVTVNNSSVDGNWWACGLIAGLHNSGNITNCTVTNSSVKSTGGTSAIVGTMNETDGTRKFTNCKVTGCTVECTNANTAEPWYAGGAIVGLVNLDHSTIEFNNCQTENNTFKGEFSNDSYYGYSFSPVKINGASVINTAEELEAAIKTGGNIILGADIAMTAAIYENVDVTIDGNGHTISQAEGTTNEYALFDSVTGKLTLKNIVFDGIKGGAVLRTIGAELTLDNITVKNCEHTKPIYGLFRLIGKNTIKNSKFENNKCISVITFNTEGDDNTDPQLVQNCEFKNNTCSATAVVHYSTGGGATLDGNKFVNNILTVSNGATVYLGFKKNCTVTNNLFDGNTVTATSKRSAGGLMVGNEAVVTGNAFVNNTVTVNGATGYGNDVCASPYYAAIDLSGNYWGGGAPVEGDDYYKEYDNYEVIINDYLTENPIK